MRIIFLSFFLILFFSSHSQKVNPDVDLISEIIAKKQEEIKQRVLKNIVVKNIKTTNYTTYNSIYNLVDILTTEKNKTVMTKSLVTEITDFSFTYALAKYFIENEFKSETILIKDKKLKELISFKVDTSSNEVKEKVAAPKEGDTLNNRIITNFIIDELNATLKKDSFLLAKGLFSKRKLTNEFKFGLNTKSGLIDSTLRASIKTQILSFSVSIKEITHKKHPVFDLINKADSIRFDRLETLSKEDIREILDLFSESLNIFRRQVGGNSFIAKIGDIITQYVIFKTNENDPEKVYDFKIDVEAIILGLESEFYKGKITSLKKYKVGIDPFFIIGINYGVALTKDNAILNESNTGSISQVAFVSEKVGFKITFADFEYTRSHRPMEWYLYKGKYRRWLQPQKNPLINDFHAIIYASGIIYNIVDLKSENNFDFSVVGVGLGVSFFNDLEVNVSYAAPIIDGENLFDNGMINLGFDIPIFEYIAEARAK